MLTMITSHVCNYGVSMPVSYQGSYSLMNSYALSADKNSKNKITAFAWHHKCLVRSVKTAWKSLWYTSCLIKMYWRRKWMRLLQQQPKVMRIPLPMLLQLRHRWNSPTLSGLPSAASDKAVVTDSANVTPPVLMPRLVEKNTYILPRYNLVSTEMSSCSRPYAWLKLHWACL